MFYLACGVLVAALVLGGSARSGLLSDIILQILALPLLAITVWQLANRADERPPIAVLVFCACLAAVPLLQLIPLPPSIWTMLPLRDVLVEAYRLQGSEPSWHPLSMEPPQTWWGALTLTVPLAVFLAVAQLDLADRRALVFALLGIAAIAVFLGLSQIAFGREAALHFYDFANVGEATGFFANRNHFSAFLYCAFLFATAWATEALLLTTAGPARGSLRARRAFSLAAAVTIMIGLIAAQAMTRSRAGLVLTIVAMLGALGIAAADRRQTSAVSPAKLLGAAITLAIVLGGQFALFRIMQRFGSDPLQDARIMFAQTTMQAAKELMPAGAGVGAFIPVFALFERPEILLPNVFANRAHNDLLELWLETGVMAAAILLAFGIWFVRSAARAWRPSPEAGRGIDVALSRAATIVVALLVAHSVVDYPLRTIAMACVLALACGLLVPPPRRHADVTPDAHEQPPSVGKLSMRDPPPAPVEPIRTKPVAWQHDADWPDSWR